MLKRAFVFFIVALFLLSVPGFAASWKTSQVGVYTPSTFSNVSATLLPNGKVLLVGIGVDVLIEHGSALYDPLTKSTEPTPPMQTPRMYHTATLLNNGLVLLAGGVDGSGNVLNNAELYDYFTNTFTTGSSPISMSEYRYRHTATLLKNGKVLLAGGLNQLNGGLAGDGTLNDAELFDPNGDSGAGSFDPVVGTTMTDKRFLHTATLLGDGKVLLAGGSSVESAPTGGHIVTGIPDENPADWQTLTGKTSGSFTINVDGIDYNVTDCDLGNVPNDMGVVGIFIYYDLLSAGVPAHCGYDPNANGVGQGGFTFTSFSTGPYSTVSALGTYSGTAKMTTYIPDEAITDWIAVTIGSFTVEVDGIGYNVTGCDFSSLNENNNMGDVASVINTRLQAAGSSGSCSFDYSANGGVGGFVFDSNSSGPSSYVSYLGTSTEGFDISGSNSDYCNGQGGRLVFEGTDISGASWLNGLNGTPVNGTDPTFYSLSSADIYDKDSGFSPAGNNMAVGRVNHTATCLPDGKVLVAGGYNNVNGYLGSADIFNPSSNMFADIGQGNYMTEARGCHTATLLPSGNVLVTGGSNESSGVLSSAELYDFSQGKFFSAGNMTNPMINHFAVLLSSGTVLVSGGGGSDSNNADLYESNIGTFNLVALIYPMSTARAGHTANLLQNGQVLVIGGSSESGTLSSTEFYDPASDSFGSFKPMSEPRQGHTTTPLPDGRILVAGGFNENGVVSAELMSLGSWTQIPMIHARRDHTATLLPDGTVLIVGGSAESGVIDSAEIFYPSVNRFYPTGSIPHARMNHTATLLPNGQVLVAGGWDGYDYGASSMLYDPNLKTWTQSDNLNAPRAYHTATLLPSGKVLIAFGVNNTGNLGQSELYDPTYGTFNLGGDYIYALSGAGDSATLLPNGKVLMIGPLGMNASGALYDPISDSFDGIPSKVQTYVSGHTTTLLPDGRVLVIGGHVSGGGYINTAEAASYTEYDYAANPSMQPNLQTVNGNSFPQQIDYSASCSLGGMGFLGTSEASSGSNGLNSPTNYPRVYLERFGDSDRLIDYTPSAYPSPHGYGGSFNDTAINLPNLQPMPGYLPLPAGSYLMTVVTNSVPSTGEIISYSPPLAYPSVNPILDWVKLNGKTIAMGQTNYTTANPTVEVHITSVNGVDDPTAVMMVFHGPAIQTIHFTLENGGGDNNFDGTWAGTEPLAVTQEGIDYPDLYILATDRGGLTWNGDQWGAYHYTIKLKGHGKAQVVGGLYNYPNPFKPSSGQDAQIQYQLNTDAPIILIIYDITGHEIMRMKFGAGTMGGMTGKNTVTWNGRSLSGKVVGSGMYLYKIISGDKVLGDGRLVIVD